jgi:hypothetical protein
MDALLSLAILKPAIPATATGGPIPLSHEPAVAPAQAGRRAQKQLHRFGPAKRQ